MFFCLLRMVADCWDLFFAVQGEPEEVSGHCQGVDQEVRAVLFFSRPGLITIRSLQVRDRQEVMKNEPPLVEPAVGKSGKTTKIKERQRRFVSDTQDDTFQHRYSASVCQATRARFQFFFPPLLRTLAWDFAARLALHRPDDGRSHYGRGVARPAFRVPRSVKKKRPAHSPLCAGCNTPSTRPCASLRRRIFELSEKSLASC